MGAWPLPLYICLPELQGRSKELFIPDMPIDGMAGMTSVTVMWASPIGLPFASVRLAWKGVFSSLHWVRVNVEIQLCRVWLRASYCGSAGCSLGLAGAGELL